MNKSLYYGYDCEKTGETVSTSVFLREKKKLLSSLEKEDGAGMGEVIRAARYALKEISREKRFAADRCGGIYIYGAALEYVTRCCGEITSDGARDFFCALTEDIDVAEAAHLADFLRVAVCERICETGASDEEARTLSGSDMRISAIDSDGIFFMICAAGKVFERDAIYPLCDDETKRSYLFRAAIFARKSAVGEREAAEKILTEASRRGLDVGTLILRKNKYATTVYAIALALLTTAFTAAFAIFVKPVAAALTFAPLFAFSAYSAAKQVLAPIFVRHLDGRIPKLDKGRELDGKKCLIVTATLLFGEKSDAEIFDRLEDFYLRNKSENYTFGVLGDLGEGESDECDGDEETISYAKARISALNEKYNGGFALFIRKRTYCECQKKHLARERKRGGIEELCEFMRGGNVEYRELICDRDVICACDYLLTLDSDTVVPYGAVRKLIGAMLHPCNRAVADPVRRRVVHGHGVIQPAMVCSLSSAARTPFSRLTCGDGGIDVYSGTGRELYQSLTGKGNFCGKGMIDVDAYLAVCDGVFPKERILSHDLPEGILLRCALATDIVFTDGTPSKATSYYARLDRWMRGDLQSMVLLRGSLENARGEKKENPVPTWGKYRIADNVVRHATPLAALICASVLSLVGAGGLAVFATLVWAWISVVTTIVSVVFSGRLTSRGGAKGAISLIAESLAGSLFSVAGSAHESVIFLVASVKTFWRTFFSHEHFLDWKSAAQSEHVESSGIINHYIKMLPSALFGIALTAVPMIVAKALGVMFAVFPWVMFLCSRESGGSGRTGRRTKALFRENAAHSWRFFADNVNESTHFLPPDNYQISPVERTAMRTSPTNIGMYLLSVLSARDFGVITSEELCRRTRETAETLSGLLKWNGHFYNWYDIGTLSVTGEAVISSVDSGNFAVSAVALCEGLKEYAFEEPGLIGVIKTYEKILDEMDFSALYDEKRGVFPVVYNGGSGKFSESGYDVFMSEARLTSYYAVAKGQVPAEHYYIPYRRFCAGRGKRGLYSWSGTAFEYFMPALFLPTEKRSVTDTGLSFAFETQKRSAVKRFIRGRRYSLFGVSESQYFGFDAMMNYQYRAFGPDALALDPLSAGEEVISPYSAMIMAPCGAGSVAGDLRAMKRLGAYGKYGFYEAIDFSPKRVGGGYAVIKSYMSHHIGMAMIAAANVCFDGIFVKRFMRDPSMRAGRILLEERASPGAATYFPRKKERRPEKVRIYENGASPEYKYEHNVLSPDVYMLSNNKTRIVASTSGHIAAYDGDVCLFGSDFDRFSLGGGAQIVAEADGAILSAVPLGHTDAGFKSRFSVVRGTGEITYFSHHEKGAKKIDFSMTLKVLADHSAADISVAVSGGAKNVRLMLYFEPMMQDETAYKSHRSFSGLFLESSFRESENAVVVSRRPRTERGRTYLCVKAFSRRGYAFDVGRDGLQPGYVTHDVASLIQRPCENRCVSPMIPGIRLICEKTKKARFRIGFGRNEEDVLYSLGKEVGDLYGLDLLQRGAAEIGRSAPSLESMILRAVYFPVSDGRTLDEYQRAALREKQYDITRLYRFSISGDEPMIMARYYRSGGCQSDNIRGMLALFRYARIRGLKYDLIIMYTENDVYRKSVKRRLDELISDAGCENFAGVRGGIFTVDTGKLSAGEEYAIKRLCGLVSDCSVPLSVTARSNRYYLPITQEAERELITPAETRGDAVPEPDVKAISRVETGVFHEDGFIADKRRLKVPYAGICASRAAGFVATQNSPGFTFATNSSLGKLTPHDADALKEDSGEKLIMRINVEGASRRDYDLCACASYVDYRFGSVIYYGKVCGTSYKVKIFCDKRLAVKYFEVTTDGGGAELILSVVPCLAQGRRSPAFFDFLRDSSACAVTVYSGIKTECRRRIALICSDDGEVITDPAALYSGGKIFCGTDEIAALKTKAAKGTVSFALAAVRGDEDYEYIRRSFLCGKRSAAGDDLIPEVTLESGNATLDAFVNKWLYYQSVVSRLVARSGYYQVGGAYGFRDQLQDTLSMRTEELKRQVTFCASHQYAEGDVMHWWHNLYSEKRGHRGIRTRCSDDCAWLVYAACEYIRRNGDVDFLDAKMPFIISSPLDATESERYEKAAFSDEKYPLYTHLLLAAEKMCATGAHGLSLFGSHDWNDGMNGLGRGGKGESVWLSQFASAVLAGFSDICADRGDAENAEKFRNVSRRLLSAVEENAFDGDRYIRGYYDDGTPLGATVCDECAIDILPQSFAAFCGCDAERTETALDTAVRLLFDRAAGTVKLLSPPFDDGEKYPGYIKGYVPGTRENGGQYTHAAIWAAMALGVTGRRDEAFDTLCSISPALSAERSGFCDVYAAEPYVLAGDVYSVGALAGRAGWTWYTGAAGWYRTAMISLVFGYRRRNGGFYLAPLLPSCVDHAKMTVRRGESEYVISVSRGEYDAIFLDGKPIEALDTTFVFDGGKHEISLIVKK